MYTVWGTCKYNRFSVNWWWTEMQRQCSEVYIPKFWMLKFRVSLSWNEFLSTDTTSQTASNTSIPNIVRPTWSRASFTQAVRVMILFNLSSASYSTNKEVLINYIKIQRQSCSSRHLDLKLGNVSPSEIICQACCSEYQSAVPLNLLHFAK